MNTNPISLNLNINPCSCCNNEDIQASYRITNDYIPPVIEIHIFCPKCGQEVSKNLSQGRTIQEMFDNIIGLVDRWNSFSELNKLKDKRIDK